MIFGGALTILVFSATAVFVTAVLGLKYPADIYATLAISNVIIVVILTLTEKSAS